MTHLKKKKEETLINFTIILYYTKMKSIIK